MPVQTRTKQHHSVMEVEMENHDNGVTVEQTPRSSKLEFDENDEKIINATLKAFESGSLTPLIKEELRCTIQSRRIAEGKGEMMVEFKKPVRKKEMDDAERGRAVKRRLQNREAAQRFRQKQKDTSDYLTAKIRKLEKSSNALTEAMNSLREEKELLGQMLRDHMTVCSNPNQLQNDHHLLFESTNLPTTNDTTPTTGNNSIDVVETSQAPTFSLAQSLLSTSSIDSSATYQFTPNTAASDTSSVFFPENDSFDNYDDNLTTSPSPPLPQHHNHSVPQTDTNTHEINPDDNHDVQLMTSHNFSDQIDKSVYMNSFNATENNNLIVYDEPQLEGCYEEIIVDFADEDAEFLRNDGRTRGDSCSSVDTVASSLYGSTAVPTTGSELSAISETPINIQYINSIDISSSAYSGIHDIINSCNPAPCGKVVNITDDFLLLGNEYL